MTTLHADDVADEVEIEVIVETERTMMTGAAVGFVALVVVGVVDALALSTRISLAKGTTSIIRIPIS
jgi:hypothetical protein